MAAEIANVEIELPEFTMGETNKTKDFLANKNPLGKVPVLETEEGCIFESNAIARYVARLRRDNNLYGKTFFESGQVDTWIDVCSHELEIALNAWLYPVLGYMKFNAGTHKRVQEDVKKGLQTLENHLLLRTYLVGEAITLADIVTASALLYPMKFLLDASFRKPYPCVMRWFNTIVNQPEFVKIAGDVPLCDKTMLAADDKSGGNKKEAAKPKKKEAKVEAPPKPKKVEHPLAVLNREKPSSMVMDSWKVTYSNTKPLSKAMEWFWANLDKEGYSIYFCDYNYNNENKMMFMTCNAVGGFIQRSDGVRKYSFGVMDVLGAEGSEIKISGCWLFRGQSAEHMIEANPDAEYYTWKKVENFDDATKKKVEEYWCNEETLNGMPIADSKVFK